MTNISTVLVSKDAADSSSMSFKRATQWCEVTLKWSLVFSSCTVSAVVSAILTLNKQQQYKDNLGNWVVNFGFCYCLAHSPIFCQLALMQLYFKLENGHARRCSLTCEMGNCSFPAATIIKKTGKAYLELWVFGQLHGAVTVSWNPKDLQTNLLLTQ